MWRTRRAWRAFWGLWASYLRTVTSSFSWYSRIRTQVQSLDGVMECWSIGKAKTVLQCYGRSMAPLSPTHHLCNSPFSITPVLPYSITPILNFHPDNSRWIKYHSWYRLPCHVSLSSNLSLIRLRFSDLSLAQSGATNSTPMGSPVSR